MKKKFKFRGVALAPIPKDKQRFPFYLGDYFIVKKPLSILNVVTTDMGDDRYNYLVLLHELLESILVYHRGISEPAIVKFDKKWEEEKARGLHKGIDEPGDDYKSPYFQEHMFATKIERLMANQLRVEWKKYCKACEEVFE